MKWLLVFLGIGTNTLASILVKLSAHRPAATPLLALFRPLMLLAVASYGIAFVLYSMALTRFPLNVAHPIMTAGAIVLVGISSALLFHENVSAGTALGYSLLLAGILVLAFSAQP